MFGFHAIKLSQGTTPVCGRQCHLLSCSTGENKSMASFLGGTSTRHAPQKKKRRDFHKHSQRSDPLLTWPEPVLQVKRAGRGRGNTSKAVFALTSDWISEKTSRSAGLQMSQNAHLDLYICPNTKPHIVLALSVKSAQKSTQDQL